MEYRIVPQISCGEDIELSGIVDWTNIVYNSGST